MNRLSLILLASLVTFSPVTARAQTALRVEHDISYVEPKNERQLLDVYSPATGSGVHLSHQPSSVRRLPLKVEANGPSLFELRLRAARADTLLRSATLFLFSYAGPDEP